MTKIRSSLKWKLIIWLSLIGFITSICIHFGLLMLGSSDVNHTMRQYPILQWQKDNLASPLKVRTDNQKSINQHLKSLVQKSPYQVFHQNKLFTQLTINSVAFVDLDSKLIFKTSNTPLSHGDIGNQIAIQSRDDLSDALTGHHNSGIEPIGGNQYLVIKSVTNTNEEIIGATVSWQSWRYQEEQSPLFYISILQGLRISLLNTLGSFFWILPSTFILGWLVARIINKRYSHLYKTIEDWGNGELSSRIVTAGDDEIAISFQRLNLMADKLEKHQKNLKQLVSIEERQRLAAELHDTVKQQLFASNLQLGAAAQQMEHNISDAKESLSKAIEQNRTAFKQVNDLIFTLSPIQIGSNLAQALKKSLDEWQQDNTVALSRDINIDVELTEIQQQVIFRSIMEALQNISKHSNAHIVEVNLTHIDSTVIWSIKDNGNINQTTSVQFGQGLSLMQKRIESLGGLLSITTQDGFELKASLPIMKAAYSNQNKNKNKNKER